MAKLFVRIAGALGITALALFFVSVIPFFADPIVGAGFAAKPPSFSVNREFKGDRLRPDLCLFLARIRSLGAN